MKNRFFALYLVLFLPLTNSSCTTYKNSLLISGKTIAQNTKLEVSLEDKSSFSIDGKNLSKDILVIKHESEKNTVLPHSKFTMNIDSNSSIELINESKEGIRVDFRIYNHKSKVVQTVTNTK